MKRQLAAPRAPLTQFGEVGTQQKHTFSVSLLPIVLLLSLLLPQLPGGWWAVLCFSPFHLTAGSFPSLSRPLPEAGLAV